ncbi:hypothetical protein ABTN09_21285, partial [Acinetobacter baumannii]
NLLYLDLCRLLCFKICLTIFGGGAEFSFFILFSCLPETGELDKTRISYNVIMKQEIRTKGNG